MAPLRRCVPATAANTSVMTSKSTPQPTKKRRASLVSPSPKKRAQKVASLTGVAVASAAALSVNPNRPLYSKTTSFEAHTNNGNSVVPIHTLILGTHPSIKSLERNEYFGHDLNAFWWIAGDCLGFRRAEGLKTNGEPFKFTSDLRYSTDSIIPYEEQVATLTSHGFALWDVVQSCERKGSLDADIQNEIPNDIRTFCKEHPSIKRIVLANGSTGSTIFNKHFKEWWKSGQLKAGTDDFSQRAFSKKEEQARKQTAKAGEAMADPGITCICAIGVSPAAARYTFEQKRDYWEEHVYQPGLDDYREGSSANSNKNLAEESF